VLLPLDLLAVLLIPVLGPLQEVSDGGLVLAGQFGDMLHRSSVLDQQFKEVLEQYLQNIEVVVLHHPEHVLPRYLLYLMALKCQRTLDRVPQGGEVADAHLHKPASRSHLLPAVETSCRHERVEVGRQVGDVLESK
jgi:hypothetical protein